MTKKLYYTVEKLTKDDMLTGWKNIHVYEIINNRPKIFCDFEAKNECDSESEIQTYLDNNGYEDLNCDFIEL